MYSYDKQWCLFQSCEFQGFWFKIVKPKSVVGKLLHDTQVTYKAHGPLVFLYDGFLFSFDNEYLGLSKKTISKHIIRRK